MAECGALWGGLGDHETACYFATDHAGPHAWEAEAAFLARTFGPLMTELVAEMKRLNTTLEKPGASGR